LPFVQSSVLKALQEPGDGEKKEMCPLRVPGRAPIAVDQLEFQDNPV
jgi:hypothetical protein